MSGRWPASPTKTARARRAGLVARSRLLTWAAVLFAAGALTPLVAALISRGTDHWRAAAALAADSSPWATELGGSVATSSTSAFALPPWIGFALGAALVLAGLAAAAVVAELVQRRGRLGPLRHDPRLAVMPPTLFDRTWPLITGGAVATAAVAVVVAWLWRHRLDLPLISDAARDGRGPALGQVGVVAVRSLLWHLALVVGAVAIADVLVGRWRLATRLAMDRHEVERERREQHGRRGARPDDDLLCRLVICSTEQAVALAAGPWRIVRRGQGHTRLAIIADARRQLFGALN